MHARNPIRLGSVAMTVLSNVHLTTRENFGDDARNGSAILESTHGRKQFFLNGYGATDGGKTSETDVNRVERFAVSAYSRAVSESTTSAIVPSARRM